MTAESIRTALNERMSKNETATASTAVLVEIAAQLAELNETMREVQNVMENITNANGFRTLYTGDR
jgi:hypothetical protein